MIRRGFSLIEILICLAIIAVVGAITFPVFVAAKHSSAISASKSNLHQMHLALKLYQFDYDGDGRYGTLEEMGLPSGLALYTSSHMLGTPLTLWQSPCGQNPSWMPAPTIVQYNYYPDTGLDDLAAIAPIYQENLIMFGDMNCADHGEPLYSAYIPHRGLGVLLSGRLLDLNKPGDSRKQKWWSAPPPP